MTKCRINDLLLSDVLVDTGSTVSLLSSDVFTTLNSTVQPCPVNITIKSVSQSLLSVIGEVFLAVNLNLSLITSCS